MPTYTYYDQVFNLLNYDPMSFEAIMEHFEDHKQTYVIQAIKKGIRVGTIKQHKIDGNKRLYAGHEYSKTIV